MNAPVALLDASDLAATVERARALLDEGDVIAARMLAAAAYDRAKAAAGFAQRFRAAEGLAAKARRLQGDALLIETRARVTMVDDYDAAQAAGAARKPGQRGKTVAAEDRISPATLVEIGLTKQEVHAARKLRDAERRTPGIVARAIAARIAAGLEPSRANLRAAVGTASATKEERGNNLYETPPEAMAALLALTRFSPTVWEPACGRGAISRILEDAGYRVELSDLVDYATADRHGELQRVEDFCASAPRAGFAGRPDIVTNPPYGADLNRFVAHALRAHRPRRMALLLNLNFLAGFDDHDRCFAMDEAPPARIHVFTRRLPMMHRDGWDGETASSRMNTAWFCWELRRPGPGETASGEDGLTYAGPTEILRVDWKLFEGTKPCGPDGTGADSSCAAPPQGGAKTRGFADALRDWSELNRLKARGDDLTDAEIARRDALAPVVAADLAPLEAGDAGGTAPPSALPGISPTRGEISRPPAALTWHQDYEGGRIVGRSGTIEVGAVMPMRHGQKPEWCGFVPAWHGPWTKAKTVDAAKAALEKRWRGFLAEAGLVGIVA